MNQFESALSESGTGLVKRWWRVGCSLHVDEALHCHDMGRLLPRTIRHQNLDSLPKFSFSVLYLEEDRTLELYDPYGNIRFYMEFHKFLTYFGSHLKLYLIDEFVQNTKSISRLLLTKRSPATLPLSLKKIDFNSVTGHLFQNQVSIVNPSGQSEVLDHYLHVVVESTDDVNRWLFLHCIRRPVNHKTVSGRKLKNSSSAEDIEVAAAASSSSSTSTSNELKLDPEPRNWSRRSSLAHGHSPVFRDTAFEGSSCYTAYCDRKSCPSPFTTERTRTYIEKVRRGFFRQMDLDFII